MRARTFCLAVGLSLATPLVSTAVEPGIAAAVAHTEAGEYAQARALLERLERQRPGQPAVAFELGRALYLDGEAKAATEWLELAVERDSSVSAHHQWLGRAYAEVAQSSNMLKKASLAGDIRDSFLKAVELDPASIDARSDLIEYYLQAPGFLGGSVEKAHGQATEILKRDAYEGQLARARIFRYAKQPRRAEEALEAAIAVRPDSTEARVRLGYLYQELERWDRAFAVFEEMVDLDAEAWGAYYQIGRTGAFSGRNLDRAAEVLTLYLGHDPGPDEPSLAWAHYRLGGVYEHGDTVALARREYQTAVELDPEHEEAKKALQRLR